MQNSPHRLRMRRELCAIHLLSRGVNKDRQHNRENASFSWSALYLDTPGVSLHQIPRNVQSQT